MGNTYFPLSICCQVIVQYMYFYHLLTAIACTPVSLFILVFLEASVKYIPLYRHCNPGVWSATHQPLLTVHFRCVNTCLFMHQAWVLTKYMAIVVNTAMHSGRGTQCGTYAPTAINIKGASVEKKERNTANLYNTPRPTKNGHHFADEIFNIIILCKSCRSFLQVSLEFLLHCPINK